MKFKLIYRENSQSRSEVLIFKKKDRIVNETTFDVTVFNMTFTIVNTLDQFALSDSVTKKSRSSFYHATFKASKKWLNVWKAFLYDGAAYRKELKIHLPFFFLTFRQCVRSLYLRFILCPDWRHYLQTQSEHRVRETPQQRRCNGLAL